MSRGDVARIASSALAVAASLTLLASTGCRQKMADQPSYSPLQESAFFDDGMSSRPRIAGTVARGHLHVDEHFDTGKAGDRFVSTLPEPVTLATLERGRERFDIYCSPCHGRAGMGDGMIVQRGYRKPPSFHTPDLRERPVGYLFDVITNGFGVMPSYAHQVPAEDRWAIVAYVRVLQRAENATLDDVPPSARKRLDEEVNGTAPTPVEKPE